jgi:hypothetical protein
MYQNFFNRNWHLAMLTLPSCNTRCTFARHSTWVPRATGYYGNTSSYMQRKKKAKCR